MCYTACLHRADGPDQPFDCSRRGAHPVRIGVLGISANLNQDTDKERSSIPFLDQRPSRCTLRSYTTRYPRHVPVMFTGGYVLTNQLPPERCPPLGNRIHRPVYRTRSSWAFPNGKCVLGSPTFLMSVNRMNNVSYVPNYTWKESH